MVLIAWIVSFYLIAFVQTALHAYEQLYTSWKIYTVFFKKKIRKNSY